MNKQYIKSPLNYVGGKYKILNQIIPKFPKKINTFVDLFGGGFNVGINVTAKIIIYNDVIEPLCELINYFSYNTADEVIEKLENNININDLNKENSESFLKLRNKYNHCLYENKDERILDFYTLILYSFNYQIRFNQNMKYNTPFGRNRSSYNQNTKKNLKQFIDKINNINVKISKEKFVDFDYSNLGEDDFVYCDPPYLITTGSYNDGNRGIKDWTLDDEKKLLNILDNLNSKGIKFALSNVLVANDRKNEVLTEWSKKYNVYVIENTFNNSNYRRKKKNDTIEVLITNYAEVGNE
ncbi:MAG: Dam family site-specific DNA-(adenine-N6)-methyltransferase [Tissierellia bacterium]|nr:Dam family site-specific DNA-(adenine-N6)-methyltransferase [Tissierellia bacterium]